MRKLTSTYLHTIDPSGSKKWLKAFIYTSDGLLKWECQEHTKGSGVFDVHSSSVMMGGCHDVCEMLPGGMSITFVFFLTVCRYVERNAVRANLVESAWKWPWCSLRRRSGSTPPAWLLPMKRWPVEPDRDWTAWVNRPETSAELESLHASVKRGRPYGSPRWQSDTAAKLELQSTLRARGRPRIRPAKAIKDSRPL